MKWREFVFILFCFCYQRIRTMVKVLEIVRCFCRNWIPYYFAVGKSCGSLINSIAKPKIFIIVSYCYTLVWQKFMITNKTEEWKATTKWLHNSCRMANQKKSDFFVLRIDLTWNTIFLLRLKKYKRDAKLHQR